jgi:hypothetical protein
MVLMKAQDNVQAKTSIDAAEVSQVSRQQEEQFYNGPSDVQAD